MEQKKEWKILFNRLLTGKHNLLILLLVGMLLVVIAMPVEREEEQKVKEETEDEERETIRGKNYESEIEKKLSKILSDVNGVGENEVMITLQSTAEKVVEKDLETDEKSKSETTVYCENNEEETPYVKKEMTPKIEGVVVIAQGGDDPVVMKNITEAVQALFDVDTHKIKVMKMN